MIFAENPKDVPVRLRAAALFSGTGEKTQERWGSEKMLETIISGGCQVILFLVQQVLILFVMMGVGLFCGKKGIFNDTVMKGLTDLMLFIVTPCVIIHSFQREFDVTLLAGLGISCLVAAASQIGSIFIIHALIHDKEKSKECVYRFAAVFSNCGYMALPLLQLIVGDIGVFYGAAYIAVFNLILWTYGLVLMCGDKSMISVKKLVTNPGVACVFLGMVLFFLSVHLPDIIGTPIESIAALNTPVPMMIIGYYFTKCCWDVVLKDKKVYLAMALRLVVVPMVTLWGMVWCGLNQSCPDLFLSCVISCSAPAAAATTMFAARYQRDAVLASGTVSFMTAASIVTMPLIVAAAKGLC